MEQLPAGTPIPNQLRSELGDVQRGQMVTGEAPPSPAMGLGQLPEAPASRPEPPTAPMRAAPRYIYAIGRIEARFPSVAIEKEFLQARGREDATGLTDRQALQATLAARPNRYLARQLCWVFTIEGLETYLLMPRDPADFELLLDSLRPTPKSADVDVLVGMLGPLAPPEACNGMTLPMVAFDQIYSFDRDSLVAEIPRPESIPAEQEEPFRATAGELFDRVQQLADNAGATDEHRALNYLAVRDASIYAAAAEAHAHNESLTGVDVRPSRLSAARKIVDVIFSFTSRRSDVTHQLFVRVDVTEEFPFLVTKLSPYYER